MAVLELAQLEDEPDLDARIDFYKPNMSQVAYEKEPDANVTFTFINRGYQRILDYVSPTQIQECLDTFRQNGFSKNEIDYLADMRRTDGRPLFSPGYLQHIHDSQLPAIEVTTTDNDIAIQTTGRWDMVTFWETAVMGEVNQAYFEGLVKANDLDIMSVYDEGERRLQEKIEALQANPDIKIADFGTRRHFSVKWQDYAINQLVSKCKQNTIGTSSLGLARKHGIKPIGTMAHEMPMIYAGLAGWRSQDIRDSHNKVFRDWDEMYKGDLSIALTDTFGSDFFFADFTNEQAISWKGLRHDSGDPYAFGEKALDFYHQNGIDPSTKTIVFSDGLDMNQILLLHDHFKGRVNLVFGWGTTLMNDMGLEPLNIVMKATEVNGVDTVKLSDNPGKYTGSPEKVELYKKIFALAG